MTRLLFYAMALLALPLLAEEPRDRGPDGERALRWMFAPWSSLIAESNPADWKPQMWQTNGLTAQDWELAIREWEKDPKVAEKIRLGREFREKYLREKDGQAQKLIAPEGTRDAALARMIREYAAFAESQRRTRLGPPTAQQAENFARQVAKPLRDLIDAGSDDPILAWEYNRTYQKANRRAEETEFPGIGKSAKEEMWIAWRERNRRVTEAEIIERFKVAIRIAQKDSGLKFWAGKKRIRPRRLDEIKLSVDWKVGTIVAEDGKPVSFKGDKRLVAKLGSFLSDGEGKPPGEIIPKRDAAFSAAHRLKREAQGLKEAVRRFDKISHEDPTNAVLARLQKSGRELNGQLADPLEASPFKDLVHTPGTSADDVLEAMIWNGLSRSPKHFRRRDGFFRIAFPFEQIFSKSLLSEKTKQRLGKTILIGVFLALASDQAWEHRKEIAEAAERVLTPLVEDVADRVNYNIDLKRVEPFVPKSWVEYIKEKSEAAQAKQRGRYQRDEAEEVGNRDKAKNVHGGTGDRLPPPSATLNKQGGNGRPPTRESAYNALKLPYDAEFKVHEHALTVGDAGFSTESVTPYDPTVEFKHLPENWEASDSHRLRIATTMRPTLENGKLVIPHSEGFLLAKARVELRQKSDPTVKARFTVGPGTKIPLARSEKGYYVADLSQYSELAGTYELDAVDVESEYIRLPRTDYFQSELAITDPAKVEALAQHFAEAGMGRIAEGLREEAKWMRELKYSIYPEDVTKRIEMGSLYTDGKNPPSKVKPPAENLFVDLTSLTHEEHLCTQCAGSSAVGERSLKFLYDGRPVKVGTRTVLPGFDASWVVPYHAQNTVQGQGPRLIVDAQAQTKDPRNYDATKALPQDDVLHSPGQDDPFAEDKLPKLADDEEPKSESPKKAEAEKGPRLAFVSADNHEEGLFGEFMRRLRDIGPGNHKFRFRGDIPKENERPKPLPPEPPKPRVIHPKIVAQLAELEKVRTELLDDHGFRRLGLPIRLQIPVLPLSTLYRSYLLGDISKAQFFDTLKDFLPENNPLRSKTNPSTQELMKAVAADQKKLYERVIAAAAGKAGPQIMRLGNPVMTDAIVAVFDEMGKLDVDPLVDPSSRKTLLKSAKPCFGLFSWVRR